MSSEIKCKSCSKWSILDDLKNNDCPYCGFQLLNLENNLVEKKSKIQKATKYTDLLIIQEHDTRVIKLIKRIIRPIQLVFLSIIGFVIWLITLTAI